MIKLWEKDWALCIAACLGYLDVIKYLVKHGADIRADGDVAIKRAAFFGKLECVKFLVEKGANIRAGY